MTESSDHGPGPGASGRRSAVASGEPVDLPGLSYEQARDELVSIVAQLEGGQVPLEESMQLWRRGEALAVHCSAWLDGAEREIGDATAGGAPAGPGARPGPDNPGP